jgi:hypothetical protein
MERRPRVLVVTENASLIIGLTFLTDAWEVVSQASITPGIDADVVVVDLGSLEGGVRALERAAQTPAAGAVVVGDGSLDADIDIGIGTEVRFLPRPFVFLDLAAEIDALLASHADRSAADPRGDRAPADEPRGPGTEGTRSSEGSEGGHDGTGTPGLFGRLRAAVSSDGAPDREEAEEQPDDPAKTPESEECPARVNRSREAGLATTGAQTEDQGAPSGEGSGAPASDEGPAEGRQEPHRRTRWFARRAQGVQPRERELRARLARVLSAVSELELLIDEVPALTSLEAIGRFLVDDLVASLEADSAGFWRDQHDGWHLVAGRGLTAIESTMVVPHDQPLFSEVHRTGGGLLIDPVDQAQAAVAGIGGAHTESFMAAAIAVGPGRYGILSVGRDEPLTASHLDLLLGAALEAAPGIAVAEQLLRLWARAPQPASEPEELPPRSWRDREGS